MPLYIFRKRNCFTILASVGTWFHLNCYRIDTYIVPGCLWTWLHGMKTWRQRQNRLVTLSSGCCVLQYFLTWSLNVQGRKTSPGNVCIPVHQSGNSWTPSKNDVSRCHKLVRDGNHRAWVKRFGLLRSSSVLRHLAKWTVKHVLVKSKEQSIVTVTTSE